MLSQAEPACFKLSARLCTLFFSSRRHEPTVQASNGALKRHRDQRGMWESKMAPQMASHEGECIGKGGCLLLIPSSAIEREQSCWSEGLSKEYHQIVEAKSSGVVRSIARSDHCRCVS